MDSAVFKPCPGLNLHHGFLRKIQHNINSSMEEQEAELNRRVAEETSAKAERKKKRRPSIQIYKVPARRIGCDFDTYSGIPYILDLTKDRSSMFFDDQQRPVEVEETAYMNHNHGTGSTGRNMLRSTGSSSSSGGSCEHPKDLREHLNNIRKSKVQKPVNANGLSKRVDTRVTSNQYDIVKMEMRTDESLAHSQATDSEVPSISHTTVNREVKREKTEVTKIGKAPFVPIKIKIETRTEGSESVRETGHSEAQDPTSAITLVRDIKKEKTEEIDLQRVKAEKTSYTASPVKQYEEQRLGLPRVKTEKLTAEKSAVNKSLRQCTLPKLPRPAQDLAEQTLLKSLSRAKHDDQNGHWTIGDSCLVMETIKDPSLVSEESLRRVAMALVTNSLLSDICHFRMVHIALVIIQKEKTLSESRHEQRFVDALLLACVNHRRSAESHPLPMLIPLISFTSQLYCCDIVRQTMNPAWAELLCDLFVTFIAGLANLTEAEKFFSLVCKTGPHLQKDIPSQVGELFRSVKTVFLADKTEEPVKDILLDLIEIRAGGWKRI